METMLREFGWEFPLLSAIAIIGISVSISEAIDYMQERPIRLRRKRYNAHRREARRAKKLESGRQSSFPREFLLDDEEKEREL
jgi:hypothetical protein